MKLPSSAVGTEVGPVAQTVDARWLMAYAAGLGEQDARYYDTRQAAGPMAHPVFSVCYEWPLARRIRERIVSADLELRSVHAQHDLRIHRPPRAGDRLITTARVIAVVQRQPGALMVVRYQTADARGEPVTTTEYGSLYRSVAVDGPDCHGEEGALPPPTSTAPLPVIATIQVPPTLAHVYTECARIWNPIHTDPAVAVSVGLPGIILHGTATLALTVSQVLSATGRDPSQVTRIACRFTGMVVMPSTLTIRGRAFDGPPDVVRFDAVEGNGRAVLSRGALWT